MDVELIRSDEARALLEDAGFRSEWMRLCGACPWATPFQSPGFVATWYEAYRERFEPVLVLSRQEGELSALLPLAIGRKGNHLAVAGTWHAEYQAWLARPEVGSSFPLQALGACRELIPSAGLSFHYLPPGAPVEWLGEAPVGKKHHLQSHRRPLLRFGDGKEIAKSFNKSGNKSRLKQLGKIGPIRFERITDPARFGALFDQIIDFHDARHMAVRGSAPFLNDPLKKPFHLAMAGAAGLLHITALYAGDVLASAHLGVCGRKDVQLGIIAHNPWLARFSPGKFHIYYLAQMLQQEGYEYLDLTAGGDPYKERFANDWDTVHTLSLFATTGQRRLAAIRCAVASAGRQVMTRVGLTPRRAHAVLDRLRQLGPLSLPAVILHAMHNGLIRCRGFRLYHCDAASARRLERPAEIHRDALGDLLSYRPPRGYPSCRQFLDAALSRIEAGQHLYTCVEDNRLSALGWMSDRGCGNEASADGEPGKAASARSSKNKGAAPDVARAAARPSARGSSDAAGPEVLQILVLPHARRRGVAAKCLRAMLRDAAEAPGCERIAVHLPPTRAARRVAEELSLIPWQARESAVPSAGSSATCALAPKG